MFVNADRGGRRKPKAEKEGKLLAALSKLTRARHAMTRRNLPWRSPLSSAEPPPPGIARGGGPSQRGSSGYGRTRQAGTPCRIGGKYAGISGPEGQPWGQPDESCGNSHP